MSATRMSFEERRKQALELKAQGLDVRQIADRLGLSYDHTKRLAAPSTRQYETTLRAAREGKQRRRGRCVDCGAETRYDGHGGRDVARRCVRCAAIANGEAQRGAGTTQRRVLDFIGDGERRFTEIADACGIEPHTRLGGILIRLLRHGLIERPRRGVYRRIR